ncbi:hypothetical protein QR680_011681 [Steinernema hermaphroditum]|uniref:Uncharacterized protein n=1 Tax=Steinernema hermaphroditum TaxID=289476 RepID=A0AA39I0W1_9BILA|nr:hypothetical protein QR680_011681 [Steinernema hermaphroditum]
MSGNALSPVKTNGLHLHSSSPSSSLANNMFVTVDAYFAPGFGNHSERTPAHLFCVVVIRGDCDLAEAPPGFARAVGNGSLRWTDRGRWNPGDRHWRRHGSELGRLFPRNVGIFKESDVLQAIGRIRAGKEELFLCKLNLPDRSKRHLPDK